MRVTSDSEITALNVETETNQKFTQHCVELFTVFTKYYLFRK